MRESRRGRSRAVEQIRRRRAIHRKKVTLHQGLVSCRGKGRRDKASPAKVRAKGKANRARLPMARVHLKMQSPHRTVSRVKAAHKAKELAVRASHRAASPPTSRAKRDCEVRLNEAARNRVPANHKGAIKVAKVAEQGAAMKDRSRENNSPNGTNACAMSSRWSAIPNSKPKSPRSANVREASAPNSNAIPHHGPRTAHRTPTPTRRRNRQTRIPRFPRPRRPRPRPHPLPRLGTRLLRTAWQREGRRRQVQVTTCSWCYTPFHADSRTLLLFIRENNHSSEGGFRPCRPPHLKTA